MAPASICSLFLYFLQSNEATGHCLHSFSHAFVHSDISSNVLMYSIIFQWKVIDQVPPLQKSHVTSVILLISTTLLLAPLLRLYIS
jgi:hypothetical protein